MDRFVAAIALGLACSAAVAQDTPVIIPSAFAAPVGARIELAVRDARDPAAPRPWDDAGVAWSLVRVSGTQENSDRAPRADENAPAGTIRCATSGAAVVGVDFRPRTVHLDAAAFAKLAATTGPKTAAPGAAVRLIQSAKTIVRIGASEPGQSSNVTSKTGQQVELRPTFDPTGIGLGSDIPIVVYAGDGKAPGAKLVAIHVPTGEKQEFTTNDSAIGSFRLSRAGEWRVEFRLLTEAKDPKEGEPAWVLYTATLTFEAARRAELKGDEK